MRQANVTGLQWSQVDLVRRLAWIHADRAKARKAIAVPLNVEALAVIRTQLGRNTAHAFSFRGEPVLRVSSKAWYPALARAGIRDFRWHDLRHTWASWHVQDGTSLAVLQELGGWESPEMVRRCPRFTAERRAPYTDRLCALRGVDESPDGTLAAQAENKKGLA